MLTNQTTHLKPRDVVRRTYALNADGVALGRLAALASQILRGKGKPTFSPHADGGDTVVIINAAKVLLTGKKAIQKIDFRASGYRGGQTYTHYGKLLAENPERAVELAVSGMLPKNRLRHRFLRRLKVFRDESGKAVYPFATGVNFGDPKLRKGGPYVPKAATVAA